MICRLRQVCDRRLAARTVHAFVRVNLSLFLTIIILAVILLILYSQCYGLMWENCPWHDNHSSTEEKRDFLTQVLKQKQVNEGFFKKYIPPKNFIFTHDDCRRYIKIAKLVCAKCNVSINFQNNFTDFDTVFCQLRFLINSLWFNFNLNLILILFYIFIMSNSQVKTPVNSFQFYNKADESVSCKIRERRRPEHSDCIKTAQMRTICFPDIYPQIIMKQRRLLLPSAADK